MLSRFAPNDIVPLGQLLVKYDSLLPWDIPIVGNPSK